MVKRKLCFGNLAYLKTQTISVFKNQDKELIMISMKDIEKPIITQNALRKMCNAFCIFVPCPALPIPFLYLPTTGHPYFVTGRQKPKS